MKPRIKPVTLFLFVLLAAVLARLIGGSAYLSAQTPCPYPYPYPYPQSQNGPWGGTQYDHQPGKTIANKGCGLTCLSMAINYYFFHLNWDPEYPIDPGTLNGYLSYTSPSPPNPDVEGAFDGDYNIAFNVSTQLWGIHEGFPGLQFRTPYKNSSSPSKLASELCLGYPVIVRVGSSWVDEDTGETVSNYHFVLVTGQIGNDFFINDPGPYNRKLLSQTEYDHPINGIPVSSGGTPSGFTIRGHVDPVDPAPDGSSLNVSLGIQAEFLMVDPLGRRAGFYNATGEILDEIPEAAYFRDAMADDVTGEPAIGVGHVSQILQPLQGTYNIILTGLTADTLTLVVRAFSQDGSPQPPLTIQGVTDKGSISTFQIYSDSTPGTVSTITRVATFDSTLNDVRNGLQLGFISQGIATSLEYKIQAAAAASVHGVDQASRGILGAIKNEVNAQKGNQINNMIGQVLLEDIDSLLSQLPQ
jgi:hypothetical protein